MASKIQPLRTLQDLKLYSRLLSYVLVYRWYFLLSLVFTGFYSLTTPGIAVLMKPLLDGSFVAKDPAYILWTPLVLILLFATRGVTNYIGNVCMNWLTGRVVYDLQNEMIDRMVNLPSAFYDEIPTAQIMSRTTSDVNLLTEAASQVIITIIRESLTILGLLVWIFILDWQLSLLLLVATPLIGFLVSRIARRLRGLHRDSMQMMARLLQQLQEVTSYHRLVKLSGTQEHEKKRLGTFANQVRRLKLKQSIASEITVPAGEFISTVVIAGTVYFSLSRDLNDPLTVGGFVSFMAALALISSSMKRLLRINETLQTGLAASERVFFLLDQTPEKESGTLKFDNQQFEGRITFQNVSFLYSKSKASSLRNICLEIEPCQTIALVGASGSGKSTLAGLIPRLYELQEGSVKIDGVDIRKYLLSEVRKKISFVSQDIFLFDNTIAANIAYGNLEQASDESIHNAAKSAYALDFIENLPKGFDTIVGEKGIRLSGGQKQRIAIARAFIKDAPILIFDEATSAMDANSEFQVRNAINALGSGRTVIIVAHRLASIENVDRIVVLNEGQIVEDGTHQELLDRKSYYHQLYTVYGEQTGKPPPPSYGATD